MERNAHLYLDIVAPNPSRRAHWALVRAGSFTGPVLLSIRLDNDSTVTEERTTDEEWKSRVTLAQELVDARNDQLAEHRDVAVPWGPVFVPPVARHTRLVARAWNEQAESQPSGPGLTPEQARAHAERLVKSLSLVSCIEPMRYETATRELGYGLLNIFGRSDLPPFLRPPETRSEPDPTSTTAAEEIVAQEGSEAPNEAFAQEESPLDAAINAVQRLIESEGGELQSSLFAQSVANQRQARALEQAEARAWEATCAALTALADFVHQDNSNAGDLARMAVVIGRATAQAFAEGSETRPEVQP